MIHGCTPNKKARGVCMVITCVRPALYRNPNNKGPAYQGRGYCAHHKSYAYPRWMPPVETYDFLLAKWHVTE